MRRGLFRREKKEVGRRFVSEINENNAIITYTTTVLILSYVLDNIAKRMLKRTFGRKLRMRNGETPFLDNNQSPEKPSVYPHDAGVVRKTP